MTVQLENKYENNWGFFAVSGPKESYTLIKNPANCN